MGNTFSGGSSFTKSGEYGQARFAEDLKAQVSVADIDDDSKARMIAQINQVGEIEPSQYDAKFGDIVNQLKAKKSISAEVAAQFAKAVENASKTQSTFITKGQPVAVAPTGNSTTLITSGTV